jgi:ATP-dependent DNA helicase RecG
MDRKETLDWVKAVQGKRFEGSEVEVKAARHGLPRRLYETLSAFANHTGGGMIILGLDETHGFAAVGVGDPQRTLSNLSDQASRMEPPLRLAPTVVQVEGNPVIVFEVPECDYQRKPCYYGPAGMNSGAYIRVGNSNRRMTDYEIFTYVSSRGQPMYDREPVRSTTLEDLSRESLEAYLARVKREKPRLWERLRLDEKPFSEQLCALNIAVQTREASYPTLAGLLVFGLWPQRYFPSLTITFVRYYGTDTGMKGVRGERFLDNCKFEGRLGEMVDDAVRRILANMRHGTLIEGVFHRTVLEYPEEAVREVVINAVAHRDYSPLAQGSSVRIEMYADRLAVITPGGLHGPVNEDNLEVELSTRNQLLMRLLEETRLVENRGSGIPMMITSMREAHLEPPQFHDTRASFRVIFKNHTLLDPETVTWLNQFVGYPLTDAQRMAIVYLRTNPRMTNSDYRRLNNTTTVDATRELRELVDLRLIEMHGTRRWAYYMLAARAKVELEPADPQIRLVLNYVCEHGSINNRECRDLLGWKDEERGKAYRLLYRLAGERKLRKEGRGRGTRYTRL